MTGSPPRGRSVVGRISRGHVSAASTRRWPPRSSRRRSPPPRARRHETLAGDALRLREDAGVSRAQLARRVRGRPPLPRAHRGRHGVALDHDVPAARLGPRGGPSRAPLPEHRASAPGPPPGTDARALLAPLHPRWTPFTELAVRQPSRGWIDLGLHDAGAHVFLAAELQSELRRLEQLVRWSTEKAASLPSWEGWAHLGDEPAISSCWSSAGHVHTRGRDGTSRASCASRTRLTRRRPRLADRHGAVARPGAALGRAGWEALADRRGPMSARACAAGLASARGALLPFAVRRSRSRADPRR